METAELLTLTADIVAAYVGNNAARTAELPDLIAAVHKSLADVVAPKPEEAPPVVSTPAVPVKKSIHDDYLICLDDGKKFKSLKRHLAQLGMTPDEYRAKWGLPRDYPMVAPGYAAKRSELAKLSGLGNNRRMTERAEPMDEPALESAPAEVPAPEAVTDEVEPDVAPEVLAEEEAPAPKRRGRPKKAG